MAHTFNNDAFVTAYDKKTGKKVGLAPKSHLKVFPNLSLTPKAKAEQPKPAPIVPAKSENKNEKEG